MAHTTEVKFGDLQRDERYRKLERTLKLAFLRQGDGGMTSGRESSLAPTWPSLSSINGDSCDPNSTVRSLQSCRLGSEVISSSKNLRNLMLKGRPPHFNQEVMTTSSVKQYPLTPCNANDRDIMPPPSITNVPQGHKKRPSVYDAQAKMNNQDCNASVCNSVAQKAVDTKEEINQMHNRGNSLQGTPKEPSNRTIRVFSRWRVLLNEQGQLIIKGTLECGKVARSKSVIRRLTATSVESIYKHTYHLQGNIVDERHELPDYVRGKFYSGFPDDWENVYQIWRTYVAQGCKLTFRWPTPITDSDDDLKSEVTEITFAYRGIQKTKEPENETLERSYASVPSTVPLVHRPCSRANIDVEHGKMHCCCGNGREEKSPFLDTTASFKKEISAPRVMNDTKIMSDSSSNKENNKALDNSHVSDIPKQTNKLKDIIREDKLDIIIDNLTNKNCPQEYINKVIEMFDCMNYVVSYRSAAESECDVTRTSVQNCSKPRSANEERIVVEAETSGKQKSIEERTYRDVEMSVSKVDRGEESQRKGIKRESSDNSESETYAGIPKISVAKLIQRRAAMSKPFKRRKRHKSANSESTKHYDAERLETEQSEQMKSKDSVYHDSSISVTEDEVESVNAAKRNRQENRFEGPKSRSYKHPSHTEQMKNNCHFENRSLHYTEEMSTPQTSNKTMANGDSNNMKSQTKSSKLEAVNDQPMSNTKYQRERMPYETTEKTHAGENSQSSNHKLKPTVISSVPINMNVRLVSKQPEAQNAHVSDVSFVESEGKDSFKSVPVEQNNSAGSTRKTSPQSQKTSPPAKKLVVNSSPIADQPSTDKKQNSVNESEHKSSVKSPRSAKNTRTKESESESNAKLLTAWVPLVVRRTELNNELGLIFKGKLLNEAGHVVHRKFSTGIVRRRVSPALIETVNHELYRLVGNLHDSKHTVPKELLKHCLNGCPPKIDQFCKQWNSLQAGETCNTAEKSHDTTMDSLSVPVSSRGRRILPPLNYWNGERVTLKDNNLVYSPGNSQESTISSTHDSPKKNSDNSKRDNSKTQSKQDNTSVKKKTEAKTTSVSTNKEALSHSARNTEDRTKHRQSAIDGQKKIAQQLKFSSLSESSEDENVKRYRRNSARSPKTSKSASKSGQYRSKLRKRQKIESEGEKSPERSTRNPSPRKAHHGVVCTYYRDVPMKDDALSDDLASEF